MPVNRFTTIAHISKVTAILPEDIAATLVHMGVLGFKRKDGGVVLAKEEVREWVRARKVDVRSPVQSVDFVVDGAESHRGRDE